MLPLCVPLGKQSAPRRWVAGALGHSDESFAKLMGLLQEMFIKLELEARAAARKQAKCHACTAKMAARKAVIDGGIATLSARLCGEAARLALPSAEVAEVQGELAALSKELVGMDQLNQQENAARTEAKADLDLGLAGVRKALDALRGYYGGSATCCGS